MEKKTVFQTLVGIIFILVLAVLVQRFLFGKSPEKEAEITTGIRIGFSLGDLREERWQKDRDMFVAAAKKQGAFVQVVSANSDAALQNEQVENLISQGVDVIVIAPYDAEKISSVVDKAHKANIKTKMKLRIKSPY